MAGAALFVVAVPIVNDQLGTYLPDIWEAWLLGAVGAIARILALQQAQQLLAMIGLGAGVENKSHVLAETVQLAGNN